MRNLRCLPTAPAGAAYRALRLASGFVLVTRSDGATGTYDPWRAMLSGELATDPAARRAATL